MGRVRRLVKLIILGRHDGVRARVRRASGLCAWVDRAGTADTYEGQAPPSSEAAEAEAELEPGFHRLLNVEELPPGGLIEVIVEGRAVALANVEGSFYAVSNVCPHAGGPLGDGALEGSTLTCPWHGWSYDVATGQCHVDADVRLERFDVMLVEGGVCVRI